MFTPIRASVCALAIALAAPAFADDFSVKSDKGASLSAQALETFDDAWAMTFLPDGRAVVTEKGGTIWLLNKSGKKTGKLGNAPKVKARGQGGMGDFIAHPDFAKNRTVFLSYVQRDKKDGSLSGAVVERAKLILGSKNGQLSDREIIWSQSPKVTGNGHYGHRLAISPDGYLFITSGERQKFNPAQNMDSNLGKVLRINQDGSVPTDNPFYGSGGVTDEIWTLGHRNPLGIDFDSAGRLWVHEMGPRDGDELNLIVRSANYGYPEVSNGKHYSGVEIPDHDSNPIYEAPKEYWVPAISPSGFEIYDGGLLPDYKGSGFIGGLSSMALVRIDFTKDSKGRPSAKEAERFEWERRIREVEQGPDGALYVLEDNDGRLLRLSPAQE